MRLPNQVRAVARNPSVNSETSAIRPSQGAVSQKGSLRSCYSFVFDTMWR